jgi:hypothetical protein
MARRWAKLGLLVLAAVAVGGVLIAHAANTPPEAKYVGSDQCRHCHSHMFGTWMETGHAKAFSALLAAEQKNPDCLKCHVTGFGKPGGFVDVATTATMENVGCEMCHGPGSVHVAGAKGGEGAPTGWEKAINRTPDNVCVQCHNTHINWKQRATELRAKQGA